MSSDSVALQRLDIELYSARMIDGATREANEFAELTLTMMQSGERDDNKRVVQKGTGERPKAKQTLISCPSFQRTWESRDPQPAASAWRWTARRIP